MSPTKKPTPSDDWSFTDDLDAIKGDVLAWEEERLRLIQRLDDHIDRVHAFRDALVAGHGPAHGTDERPPLKRYRHSEAVRQKMRDAWKLRRATAAMKEYDETVEKPNEH